MILIVTTEQFSNERDNYVIAIFILSGGLKNIVPVFQPIKGKT